MISRYLTICLIAIFSFASAETVIISGHLEYPPVMYRNGQSIEGVGTDILQAVFKDLGISVKSKYVGNWARTWFELENGKVDIITGCYINEERKKSAKFSHNYLVSDPMVIYVRKGAEFQFDKWEDLIGKKGGNTLGDSQGAVFDEF